MKFFNLLFSGLFVCACSNAQRLIAEGAVLTLVSDRFEFTEGPAVDAVGNVYFTDQPNDRIVKWDASDNSVTDWMHPSGRSNGLFFDKHGNLISCADAKNQLWRIDKDRNFTVLVDGYLGKKLGGPNDVWVHPNGTIYFTDPYYQRSWWEHTEPEIEARRVYYMSPNDNQVKIAAEDFIMPNGIVGSGNGKLLYIADIKGEKTYRYTINNDGSLADKTLFCTMGSDGMTLDGSGNVYLTGKGVTVFDAKGNKIEHIEVPESWTANVTFGGKDRNILFITAMDAVYTLKMNVSGIQ